MIQKTRNQAINAFRPNTANMPISSASVIRMTFRVYWLEDFSETLELHYLRGFYFTASYFITSWYYYVVVFVIRYWMIYLPYSKREQQKKNSSWIKNLFCQIMRTSAIFMVLQPW